jgi:hypothetical protein
VIDEGHVGECVALADRVLARHADPPWRLRCPDRTWGKHAV